MAAMGSHVRAPDLTGRGWLNTGGKTLTLQSLKGKVVLLDFWTFCCINCLHVLDELRPLEEKYGDVLVTIGVHSPKFEHEKNADAVADAVERYGVSHPVLDDPEMTTWRSYAARAWPTLVVIDPEGYVASVMAGEGHAAALDRLIGDLVTEHEKRGTLRHGDSPYVSVGSDEAALRYPGKAVVTPARTLLVSSSAQHQIVEFAEDTETVLRRIGSGKRGAVDGPLADAQFSEPQGLCVLPEHVRKTVGYDVVIADTVNHMLRGLTLEDGAVQTIAGTGEQRRATHGTDTVDARLVDLSSPWDVAWFEERVIVAMAGTHQLWWFDPIENVMGVYAGTTVEALKDGPLPDVWLAQPSGLSANGSRLWIADSETSALRWIENGVMTTAVGQGLFNFGLVDGPAWDALLQHPLGVCALNDGTVLIADTYNSALRRYDPSAEIVSTVTMDLAEPSDVIVGPDGDVIVVESAAHRLTKLPKSILSANSNPEGSRHEVERPPTEVSAGEVTLEVIFTVDDGQKLDNSFGDPVRLEVSASPTNLLVAGAGTSTDLKRELMIASDIEEGVLQVVAQVATCDAQAEHPACHLTRQDWGVPVRVVDHGSKRIGLVLKGMDDHP